MSVEIPRPVLKGAKALVVGIANEHSIAYGCAAAFRELGADVAVTYLNEKAKQYVEPIARKLAAVDPRAGVADFAAARLDEAHDGLQGGRLAGAVAADEGDHLALFDREPDVEEHLRAAIAGAQAPHLKHRQGRPRALSHACAPRPARPRR